jgi:Bacterial protein of unknown function (DUF937)
MATNLVSLVMQFLTPDMIARIAAALGIDRGSTETAVGAAVPGLLAGLVGAVAKPDGAQRLVDAARQQSGAVDSFADMLSSGSHASVANQGSQLLSSLLGGDGQSALAGALTKFTGIGEGKAGSLLGMLAPVVVGMIGKEAGATGGLNAGGLVDLLGSQKANIAQALPSGFSDVLGRSGLLGSLGGVLGSTADTATRTTTAAAGQAGRMASASMQTVGSAGQRATAAAASGMPRWAYWVIPLAVIAALLWYGLGNRAPQVAGTQPPATQSTVIGGTDVGKVVGDDLGTVRSSLEGVTDVASAKTALPKLQDVDGQLDKVASLMGQASPDQKQAIKGTVDPALATLNPLFDKVLAIPGVGDVLKPSIDELKTKLATLTA